MRDLLDSQARSAIDLDGYAQERTLFQWQLCERWQVQCEWREREQMESEECQWQYRCSVLSEV